MTQRRTKAAPIPHRPRTRPTASTGSLISRRRIRTATPSHTSSGPVRPTRKAARRSMSPYLAVAGRPFPGPTRPSWLRLPNLPSMTAPRGGVRLVLLLAAVLGTGCSRTEPASKALPRTGQEAGAPLTGDWLRIAYQADPQSLNFVRAQDML